jgi:hypothetical protein
VIGTGVFRSTGSHASSRVCFNRLLIHTTEKKK